MKTVVRPALLAPIWAFLFPTKVSDGGTQQQYRRHRLLLWGLAGLGFSALGWIGGGFLGSWAPRIACAAGATALALGLLNRQPGAALVGAVSAAIVSLAAVRIGESFFSPLLAWPVAGLVISVAGAFAFRRRRARIAFMVAAPLLGSVGVVAGMLAIFLTAMRLNDSRVAAQTMLGGAVGFGLLLMAGAAVVGRWLDASPAAGRAS
ncbi:MAG TPA: hypothetical protein VEH47_01570, partial [Candidatus Acidoferrales bacterium]|nr:hypothetical protein [Candidatus Acidoferrales bacterium]